MSSSAFLLLAAARAANMTALINNQTERAASAETHRCMLSRTQTAQYEATPLPVPPCA